MVKLYTVAEVADLMRCSRQVVYRLVRHDAIPHLRLGRLIRFDAEAVEQWIRQSSGGPDATRADRT